MTLHKDFSVDMSKLEPLEKVSSVLQCDTNYF